MGDNIPDFSKMTEEEQMRWLESLAARQGASKDEFMTTADMDVPDIDPNSVVIDEPGYVPSETFSFSKHAQPQAPQPAAEEYEGVTEPMATYDAYAESPVEDQSWYAEQPASQPEMSMEDLANLDPMAFLESLAARQGADPSQFLSSADMAVPELDPSQTDMSNVGPGYVPSETFSFSQHAQPPQPPAPPQVEETDETDQIVAYDYQTELQPEDQAWYTEQPVMDAPASPAMSMEDLANTDPMAFLEALAARQGADPSQFLTAADMAVPELDPSQTDMSNVGPGYVPSETFSFSQHAQPPQPPAPPEVPLADEVTSPMPAYDEQPVSDQAWYTEQPVMDAPASQPEMSMEDLANTDPMAFLEALAARQGADPSQFLTAADMAVPELDPSQTDMSNVGPGYVPSETFSFSQHAQPPQPPAPPEVPEEPTYEAQEPVYDQSAYDPGSYDFAAAEQQGEVAPYDMGSYDFGVAEQGTGEQPAYDMGSYDFGATEQPVGEQPAYDMGSYDYGTEQPLGEQPTYDPGSYDFGATEQPVGEQPAYDMGSYDYGTEQPLGEQPTYDPGSYDFGATEQPVGEQPAYDLGSYDFGTEQPLGDQPAYDMGSYDFGATEQPVGDQPAYDLGSYDFGTEQPLGDQPAYDMGSYDFGATEQPVGDQPAYDLGNYDFAAYDQSAEAIDALQPPAGEMVDGELMAEVDPMKWLESLARRQGASPDEFVTAADIPVPEVDPSQADMSNLGPGYTPYSPYETTPGQSYQAAEPPAPPVEAYSLEVAPADAEDSSPLSWLEDLASDQGAAPTDFLGDFALEGGALPGFDLDFDTSGEEATAALAASVESAQTDDFLAGMTDEEIARMQVQGTITPDQELAWLMQKADRMGEILQGDEVIISQEQSAEVLPGELPPWLQSQMPDLTQLSEGSQEQYPAFIDDLILPPEPEGVADWLQPSPDSPLELELPAELMLEDASQLPSAGASGDLLAGYSESQDPWVQAFEAEAQATTTSPEWYKEALSQAEDETPLPITDALAMELELQAALAQPVPASEDAMPDWLGENAMPAATEDTDLPEWLRMSVSDTGSGNIGDWLREQQTSGTEEIVWEAPEATAETVDAGGVDDWLQTLSVAEVGMEPPAEAAPVLESVVAFGAPAASGTLSRAAQLAQNSNIEQGVDGVLPPWYSGQKPVATMVATAPPAAPPTPPPAPRVTAPPPAPVAPPPAVASAPPAPRPAATPIAQQPVPRPAAPAPAPSDPQFSAYRSKLDQNPQDHDTRLKLARELSKANPAGGLEHYETLIENSTMLEVVVTDLSALANRAAVHPKVRRLLGDTYMRQGRLQEALDTYRGALNQL